jgi:CheY-like chemotaxis protein
MQPRLTDKIKSVMLIDNNSIDNFVNQKILEYHGVIDVASFISASRALIHLKKTEIKYQLILIDIYLPLMDGFEFIDKFRELKLYKTQGTICLLSASLNPIHKKRAAEKDIKFIEKPLIIENLLINI